MLPSYPPNHPLVRAVGMVGVGRTMEPKLRFNPAMAKVEIYTTSWCPFCRRALALLDGKAVTYTNIDVEEGRGQKHAMSLRSGGRTTVPQVFINDQHIGGYEELQAVDDSGKLDALLQA